MTTGKLYERVAIKLSDAAVLERGKKLAAKDAEYRALQEEKSEALNSYNAKLKTLEAEMHDISNEINGGVEEKDIEIREEPDYARKMVLKVRVDNGQPIGHRPMTLNEEGEEKMRLLRTEQTDGEEPSAEASSDEGQEKPKRGRRRKGDSEETADSAAMEH